MTTASQHASEGAALVAAARAATEAKDGGGNERYASFTIGRARARAQTNAMGGAVTHRESTRARPRTWRWLPPRRRRRHGADTFRHRTRERARAQPASRDAMGAVTRPSSVVVAKQHPAEMEHVVENRARFIEGVGWAIVMVCTQTHARPPNGRPWHTTPLAQLSCASAAAARRLSCTGRWGRAYMAAHATDVDRAGV